MKKSILISLVLFCSITVFAQQKPDSDPEKINALIQDSFDHIWSELSYENIEKYYTTDFLLLENGEIWNNDSIRSYFDQATLQKPKPKRINRMEFISTKIDGNRAWVAYQNYAVTSVGGKVVRRAHWLESATAIWTEEGWKVDMLHSTRIEE